MTNQTRVLIYTTPTCPFCIKAKKFLQENGIAYDEIDVTKDEKKFDEMIEKSGTTAVPVFDIGGTVINGITDNEGKILRALKESEQGTS